MLIEFLFGVMGGVILVVLIFHYSYWKAHKASVDFQKRQENYNKMMGVNSSNFGFKKYK